jgi:hypothetical protein
MAAQELRPMGVGDILDMTFRLYRQRFLTFLLISLVVYVPYALLMALTQTPSVNPAEDAGLARALAGSVAFLLVMLVLMPLCSAALVHNISATYLGEELSVGQSYSRAAPRLLALLGSQWLAGLVIGLGLVLVVPGVIFALWFLVIVPVVILEWKAGTSALGRSRELMRGNMGKGFLLMLVLGILAWVVALGLHALMALVPWPHPAMGVFTSLLLQGFLLPIQTAPWTLLYYDLRIRKEAFDLQMLAESVGQAAAGEPTVT